MAEQRNQPLVDAAAAKGAAGAGQPTSQEEAKRQTDSGLRRAEPGQSTLHLTYPARSDHPDFDERGVMREGPMEERARQVRETMMDDNSREDAIADLDGSTVGDMRRRSGQDIEYPSPGRPAAAGEAGAEGTAGARGPAPSPEKQQEMRNKRREALQKELRELDAMETMQQALRTAPPEELAGGASGIGMGPGNPGQRATGSTAPTEAQHEEAVRAGGHDPGARADSFTQEGPVDESVRATTPAPQSGQQPGASPGGSTAGGGGTTGGTGAANVAPAAPTGAGGTSSTTPPVAGGGKGAV